MEPSQSYHKIEPYPSIKQDKAFPEGDVTKGVTISAERKLKSLLEGNVGKRTLNFRKFVNREISYWEADNAQQNNYRVLEKLTYSWGKTIDPDMEDGTTLALAGVLGSISLANKTHLFPTDFNDFYDELSKMAEYDTPTIKVFADEAWDNMFASHPNIFGVMYNFQSYMGGMFFEDYDELRHRDNDNPRLVLLDASLALPYTMSAVSSMEKIMDNNMKRYNKM